MKIPIKAQKLLRLALDSAAMPGEWQNAAVAFISNLRSSQIDIDSIAPPPPTPLPFTMPIGKYKGKDISSVSTHYLIWMRENVDMRQPLKDAVLYNLQYREYFNEA
jgi:hypothetical protein